MINPDMFMVISECCITNVRLENYRLILLAHSRFAFQKLEHLSNC